MKCRATLGFASLLNQEIVRKGQAIVGRVSKDADLWCVEGCGLVMLGLGSRLGARVLGRGCSVGR